jgi:hypothetical protein
MGHMSHCVKMAETKKEPVVSADTTSFYLPQTNELTEIQTFKPPPPVSVDLIGLYHIGISTATAVER